MKIKEEIDLNYLLMADLVGFIQFNLTLLLKKSIFINHSFDSYLVDCFNIEQFLGTIILS